MEKSLFVLLLDKAMYGLVDEPIFLHFLLSELKFYASLHDDNFLCMFDEQKRALACIIVLHVDDPLVLAMIANTQWVQQRVESTFRKMKHHILPFTWCGIVHERLRPGHFFLRQKPYLMKLKPIVLVEKTADMTELGDTDHHSFR
eukprot:2131049-Pyramimonas_sp.AAC.2